MLDTTVFFSKWAIFETSPVGDFVGNTFATKQNVFYAVYPSQNDDIDAIKKYIQVHHLRLCFSKKCSNFACPILARRVEINRIVVTSERPDE